MNNALKPEITTTLFDLGKTIHGFDLDRFFNWLARKFGIPRHYFWDMFSRYPDGLLYPYECGQSNQEFVFRFREETKKLLQELKEREGKLIVSPEFTPTPERNKSKVGDEWSKNSKSREKSYGIESMVWGFTAQEFFDAMNSVWDPEPIGRERLELLRKLKGKRYGVYVLSNIGQSQFEYLRGDRHHRVMSPDLCCTNKDLGDWEHGYRFSRFKEFFESIDGFIASCHSNIQCRKMRSSEGTKEECEKIFKKALAITKSAPEQTVFVDDILDYINIFRGMGGYGIHCTGNWTKIEHELYQLGVRWE